jgi:hypothetical protein
MWSVRIDENQELRSRRHGGVTTRIDPTRPGAGQRKPPSGSVYHTDVSRIRRAVVVAAHGACLAAPLPQPHPQPRRRRRSRAGLAWCHAKNRPVASCVWAASAGPAMSGCIRYSCWAPPPSFALPTPVVPVCRHGCSICWSAAEQSRGGGFVLTRVGLQKAPCCKVPQKMRIDLGTDPPHYGLGHRNTQRPERAWGLIFAWEQVVIAWRGARRPQPLDITFDRGSTRGWDGPI